MGRLEDRQKALYPDGVPGAAAPAAPSAAPAVDPLTERQNKLYPPPAPPDEDVTKYDFWNLPKGVSQGDYWGAEGRLAGRVVGQAAADTGLIFGDDMSFGTPGLTGVGSASPAEYRAAVEAARQRAGGGKYGIDAMAFLANKPFQAARLGLKAGQLAGAGIKAVAPQVSKDAVKAIARRVGSFVEGGAYTGAQSGGHGNDAGTVATDTAAGGVLSGVLDEGFNAAKDAGPWLRSKIYGSPEGSPADIAAGPPPGAPPRTPEQDLDTNQLNLWRSQAAHDMTPSQTAVGNYVTKVYGEDPAQWPAALRGIHKAAGKEGTVSPLTRTAGQVLGQAGAATANYLGLGLSPEVATSLHIAAPVVTEAVLPKLPFTRSSPMPGTIRNAFPALTGWRPELNTPDWRIGQ